jgi:uncharacterized membrane protein YgcG
MSTNFNVIQAQRDLAVARNNELQAQLDYQLALINFETVQRVGTGAPGASTLTPVSGGTVTIPATSATTTTTGATVSTGGQTSGGGSGAGNPGGASSGGSGGGL